MHDITKDLRDLVELYRSLEICLEKQYQDLLAHKFPPSNEGSQASALEHRVLEAEKNLARIVSAGDMNAPGSRTDGGALGESAACLKKRAQFLLNLLGRNAARCTQLQNAAQAGLREIQRGGEFLQSMRGYRENQPRYLDSHQ